MSVWGKFKDFFRRERKKPLAPAIKKPKAVELEPKKDVRLEKPVPVVVKKFDEERLAQVIRGARMSEKSVDLAERGQYVFEVLRSANRIEVKRAVESLFQVEVEAVRMANVRGKRKRQGRRDHWSKAYVRLAPGQSIESTEIGA